MRATQLDRTLAPAALRERWRRLLVDDESPERCELDAYGEVSANPPPPFAHQLIVRAIERQLEATLGQPAIARSSSWSSTGGSDT